MTDVPIQSFRDLRVWQFAMDTVVNVYRATEQLPPDERFVLTSQMRRSAVSIPSNIAEGHARDHLNEYLHHLSFAQGSAAELMTQIELARRLQFVNDSVAATLDADLNTVSRQLYALRNSLQKHRPR